MKYATQYLAAVPILTICFVGKPLWADESADKTGICSVQSMGLTENDLDRSIGFFTRVLSFEQISEAEVWENELEKLYGIFGLRQRTAIVHLELERLELTEYLTPIDRPMPIDSRSNDP